MIKRETSFNWDENMDLSQAKPIEISDRYLFNDYFKKFPPQISEFTFTNLFIWRSYYNFSFLEWNAHLIIFSETYFKQRKESRSKNRDTVLFMPPIGPYPSEIITDLFNNFKEIEMHRVPEIMINELKTNQAKSATKIHWEEDRNNWDYVYEKDKLITLAGRNLYRKRRWLNRFINDYPDHQFHLLSDEWLDMCRELQIEWCDMNECRMHEDLLEEQKAITEAFDNYSELDYRGGLLIVNDKCIAYTLGELLNPSSVVIHIEKALTEYQGAYQAINQHFVKNCCKDVEYVNREQDLGDTGLRQAKETYLPHHMVKKFIIYRNLV